MGHLNGISTKIDRYINSNRELEPIKTELLWPKYKDKKAELYADKVIKAKGNPVGDLAVLVYSALVKEPYEANLDNEETEEKNEIVHLVNNRYEYYFTDMVFIQQRYEEALIDLYLLRAEDFSNSAAINAAIDNTFWIAEQNGCKLTPDIIQTKYLNQLNIRLNNLEECLELLDNNAVCPKIKKYAKIISQATYQYYANPSEANNLNMWSTLNSLVGDYFVAGSYKGLAMLITEMRNASGLEFTQIHKNLQIKKNSQ